MKVFGPSYPQYSRKGQVAIDFLLAIGQGEVPNALFHPEIGWVDVVWGYAGTAKSDGFGLSKIQKYHPNVLSTMAATFKAMNIVSTGRNRIKRTGLGACGGLSAPKLNKKTTLQ